MRSTLHASPAAAALLGVTLGIASPAPTPANAAPQSPTQGRLGQIEMPNSGSTQAQDAFARGVLLLHNFEYEDARSAFLEAQRIDPEFALAYWGEAMTHNHPIWQRQELEAGRAALAKLGTDAARRRSKAPTDRERAFMEAVEVLFGEGEKNDRDFARSSTPISTPGTSRTAAWRSSDANPTSAATTRPGCSTAIYSSASERKPGRF